MSISDISNDVWGNVILTFFNYEEKNNLKYVSRNIKKLVDKYYHFKLDNHKILHDWYYGKCDKYTTVLSLTTYNDIIEFMSNRFLNKYHILLNIYTEYCDERLLKNLWNKNIDNINHNIKYKVFFTKLINTILNIYTMTGKKLWWKFKNPMWKDINYHNFKVICYVEEYIFEKYRNYSVRIMEFLRDTHLGEHLPFKTFKRATIALMEQEGDEIEKYKILTYITRRNDHTLH